MRPFLIFCFLAPLTGAVAAQVAVSNHGRVVPTVTRAIHDFGNLENDWLAAVQAHDNAALNKIVAPDFELRSAATPGVPTPREESLRHALSLAPFHSSIEQMAVHEYGDVAVASFMWKLDVPAAGALPQQLFVIDTWKRNEGNWQVVTRYAAPVGAHVAVPGAVADAPAVKKRM